VSLPMPVSIIHVKQQKVRVLKVVHAEEVLRRMSVTSSSCSGVATGEALAVPSPTYLRKRYKTLQSRRVSKSLDMQTASQDKASAEQDPAITAELDPSFQAIRNLNRPQPVIVNAVVKEPESSSVADKASPSSSTSSPLEYQGQRLATAEYDPQSFSARVDRLMQAVDHGNHIRFASPDRDGNVRVFARDADALSEPFSDESITAQIAAHPENFGRILGPGVESMQRSPTSLPDSSRRSIPAEVTSIDYVLSDRHNLPLLKGGTSGKGSSHQATVEATRRRAVSPIIPPNEQHALQQRIRDKIEESKKGKAKAAATTAVRRKDREEIDPRKVYTSTRKGKKYHEILPIPLDHHRSRRPGTPPVGTGESSSAESSLLEYVATRNFRRAGHPMLAKQEPGPNSELGISEQPSFQSLPTEGGPAEILSDESEETEEDRIERQAKNREIVSWLRRVGSVLKPAEDSPARKLGKAFGVFQDKPSSSPSQQPTTPANRSQKPLQDVTNTRKSGYLKWNSFAQDNSIKEKVKRGLSMRKREEYPVEVASPATAPELAMENADAGSAEATNGSSKAPSKASTVKPIREGNELHPDTAFALARLEGRVAPPALSPFQIRRSRDTDSYGSEVHVELERLNMDSPQPLRAVQTGQWSGPLEQAVEEGFDCALEAPEEPER
ncbi:MAG: hypothetical protein Q9218_007827, partial [Villophora microphyllina]